MDSKTWPARRGLLKAGVGLSAAQLLVACGGGGSSDSTPTAVSPSPAAPTLSTLDAATF